MFINKLNCFLLHISFKLNENVKASGLKILLTKINCIKFHSKQKYRDVIVMHFNIRDASLHGKYFNYVFENGLTLA